jgi:hypothetical protein
MIAWALAAAVLLAQAGEPLDVTAPYELGERLEVVEQTLAEQGQTLARALEKLERLCPSGKRA